MVCSLKPSAKLPRPSKERGLIPRKSLTRGSAMVMSLSRNSHIRSPRSVTLAPTGMPSRILNPAMLFLARRSCGFWPVIRAKSSVAPSSLRLSCAASPTPMFTTILFSFGMRIGFCISNLSLRAGAISSRYLSFNLAIYVLSAALGNANLLSGVRDPVPYLGRLPGVWVYEHHVGNVYRGFERVQALRILLARSGVAGPDTHASNDDPLFRRDDPLDLAALALLLARDHLHRIPTLYHETHHLQHLWGQRDYPRIALVSQFAGDGPEDARPARGAIVVDDHTRVLAEPDVRPVVPPRLFLRPDDHGPHHVALAHATTRRRLLDGGNDNVAHARAAPLCATQHPNGQETPGTRIVGYP